MAIAYITILTASCTIWGIIIRSSRSPERNQRPIDCHRAGDGPASNTMPRSSNAACWSRHDTDYIDRIFAVSPADGIVWIGMAKPR